MPNANEYEDTYNIEELKVSERSEGKEDYEDTPKDRSVSYGRSESKLGDEDDAIDDSDIHNTGGDNKKGLTILDKAIEYCWSSDFLDVFRAYFTRHAHVFLKAAKNDEEEHDLEFTELFNEYLELFEATLERFIEKNNSTVEEFAAMVKEVKEKKYPDYMEEEFVEALLASEEYDSFYRVMMREAKRQILQGKHSEQIANTGK